VATSARRPGRSPRSPRPISQARPAASPFRRPASACGAPGAGRGGRRLRRRPT